MIATVHYTGSLDDGTVFDSSRNIEPLRFELGSGKVINGFDQAVLSMGPGEKKSVRILPEDAYGLYFDDRIETAPMYSIPGAKDLKLGKTFYFRTQDGISVPAKILRIEEGLAYVDFNHPLAGQALNFEIELISLDKQEA